MSEEKKKRGRPFKSAIRERMQSILDGLGVAYGYEIYKVYRDAYAPIDIRSIYYHLNRGTLLGEFEEVATKEERGAFTWGPASTRKYYKLGLAATKKVNDDLHIIIKTLGLSYREPSAIFEK
ncbi:MAG: hypothetical protein ABIG20_01360 [archaeon]